MLNKKSTDLITFFIENKCLYTGVKTSKQTHNIFEYLLEQLTKSDKYVRKLRGTFQPTVSQIKNMNDIPKSSIFTDGATPKHIEDYIHAHSLYSIKYKFSLFHRKIQIFFITTNHNKIAVYNEYAERMLMWLYILHTQSSKICSVNLNVFVYFTSMEKLLPHPHGEHKHSILDENNVNTAYTYTCRSNNDIVIYRKEEWFKVFIHETFHGFGLDFSGKDDYNTKERILQIFNVNSSVNLFEAYTEFWARIMNAVFTSYYITIGTKRLGNVYIDKNHTSVFIEKCEMFIYLEQIYSCFQMVKVLNYMSVKYEDLMNFSRNSSVKMKYRENTNVLAYYVITNILMFYYQDFFQWLKINNVSLFQSNHNHPSYQMNLCNFISSHYNRPDFIKGIRCLQDSLLQLKKEHVNLRNNLRMTLCELE